MRSQRVRMSWSSGPCSSRMLRVCCSSHSVPSRHKEITMDDATTTVVEPPRGRTRAAWSLFDFCNSFVIINGSLYISQWVTSHGVREFWYGFTFSLSTVLLLLTAPAIGWIVDQTTRRVSWLRAQTVVITMFAVAIPITVIQ